MRLATWNILNGLSLADGTVRPDRLRASAASLDVDVLGIQEVDRGQPRSAGLDLTAEVAAGMDAPHWRFAPALVGTPGGHWRPASGDEPGTEAYGIGLVSRYPVRTWRVLHLTPARVVAPVLTPAGLLWLRDEPRVAMAAELDTPLGALVVATTHLSFVPGWNVVQLRRLAHWLQQAPSPSVIVGDLNLPPAVAGAVTPYDLLARHRTYPAASPRWQVDHVLGHGDLPPVRDSFARSLDVSDHQALGVQLDDRVVQP